MSNENHLCFKMKVAEHLTKLETLLSPPSMLMKPAWAGRSRQGARESGEPDLTMFRMSSMKAFLAETQKFFP